MEDNENTVNFTEAENKIRKRWLFLTTILPMILAGCFLIAQAILLFISSDFMGMIKVLLLAPLAALVFYIPYHCAYKKPGTILLLLNIIFIPLRLLIDLFHPENLVLMKSSSVYLLVMLIYIVFEISVFYYAYKLRKINKKMREKQLMASPAYINALSIFSTTTTLEELNEQLSKLKAFYGSGKSVQALAKAYKQHKQMILP